MNDLLTLAVDAHGGLARWNQFKPRRRGCPWKGPYGKPRAIFRK
jgi:hypothetical protein